MLKIDVAKAGKRYYNHNNEVMILLKYKLRRRLLKSLPIETDRLILREITMDDSIDMFEYSSIPEVTEYLMWYPHANLSATEGYIESLQKRYLRGLYGDWAVELKSEGKMIGTCGYANIDSYQMTCEIGYVLSPLYRNCGYMSEAVLAILKLSFETLGFNSATLRIISENKPSIRLAERLGFGYDFSSHLQIKGINREVLNYKISREVYFEKKEAVL